MNSANDNKERIVRTPTTQPVLNEVLAERIRQDEKWGEQNWPSFNERIAPAHRPLYYGIIEEGAAKWRTEHRFKERAGSYADIFVEEAAESIEAETEELLREELVQVAAVAVAWIEAIDRRKAKERAA